jgi:hypothetical protein
MLQQITPRLTARMNQFSPLLPALANNLPPHPAAPTPMKKLGVKICCFHCSTATHPAA